MKPLLVVNPSSGGGATARAFPDMRGTIERALGPCEVVMTEARGHGMKLALEGALAGHPLIVAVGGDGTIHEVANGILSSKKEVELGIIGQGTGGDFRKTLEIEHRLDRYLERIASGRRRSLDVGRFSGGGETEHYFVNILSLGMGGLVDRHVAKTSRALGGKVAYFGATLKALAEARLGHVRCTLTHEGKTEEHLVRSFMIAICNGQYFGGGMHVAPMASPDDGAFEIVALGATSKLGFVLTSGSVYSGDHLKQAATVHLRASHARFELVNADAASGFLLDVDGEPMEGMPLEITCVPNALAVRA
jgi:diacylglycerol kinase (ATP)